MRIILGWFLLLNLGLVSLSCAGPVERRHEVQTVSYVDLPSYLGTWYEIERFPNWFQKKCRSSKAEYSMRGKNKINVKNSCTTNKGLNVAHGIARVVDRRSNAKLKVSFVPFFNRFGWFAGDYWILDLAPDYSYVLVGSPDRNYLWILSRTTVLDPGIVDGLKGVAAREGFDISRLRPSPTWE